MRPVLDDHGAQLTVQVPLFDPPVHVLVWRADIGRVPVYLLDTDIEKNQPWDRAIGHRLYTTESEQRLRQEIVLGIGGMCVLETLGIVPAGIHINEGHPGLALLEHVRMLVQKGARFQEAVAKGSRKLHFHHTYSVNCGNGRFSLSAVRKILQPRLSTIRHRSRYPASARGLPARPRRRVST